MTKILISGYYGFDNFGDDAILFSLVSALRESVDNLDITVISGNPQKTAIQYGVKSVYRFNLSAIIREISACDVIVSGGGSLLQDVTSLKSLFYYLSLLFCAKLFGKKACVIAQGIGPIKSKLGQVLTNLILKMTDVITVRDEKSWKFLDGWGIKSTLSSDLVWLMQSKVKFSPPQNVVGIQLRNWEGLEAMGIKSIVQSVLNNFDSEKYSFKILPLHRMQDEEICEKFKSIALILDPKVKIDVVYKSTIDEYIEEISSLDYLVAVRFHAGLVAIKESVPTMMLSYDPKVEALCEDSNIPYVSIEHMSEAALNNALSELKSKNKQSDDVFVEVMKKRSRQSIDLLLKLV